METVIVNIFTVGNTILIIAALAMIVFNRKSARNTDTSILKLSESITASFRDSKQHTEELSQKHISEICDIKQTFKAETEKVISDLNRQSLQSLQELSRECRRTLEQFNNDISTLKNNFEQETGNIKNNFNQESLKLTSGFKDMQNTMVQWLVDFKTEIDDKFNHTSKAQETFNTIFNDTVFQKLNGLKIEIDKKYEQASEVQNLFNKSLNDELKEFIKTCTDKFETQSEFTRTFSDNTTGAYKKLVDSVARHQDEANQLINTRFDDLQEKILEPLSFE